MAAPKGTETPESESRASRVNDSSEASFYSPYEWALDPVLTVRQLFGHLRAELDRYETLPASWQREESRANLGVFAGAITCTVDDYLGEPAPNLLRLSKKFPLMRILVLAAQKILNSGHYLHSFSQKSRVAEWRENWTAAADAISDLLVSSGDPAPQEWRRCRDIVAKNLNAHLPAELLDRPMQLPSGYRSQDLAHQDAAALADLFAASQANQRGNLVVIGPRSMGAYFAPVLKARLSQLGWNSVSWCTLRPKKGISPWERKSLRDLQSEGTQVLVVDESPNTGNTFLLLIRMLRALGVQPERLFLLAAMHPTQPNWRLPANDKDTHGVTLIRLEAHDLHKDRALEPAAVEPLLTEYFSAAGWRDIEVTQNPETHALNARLDEHFQDGFQCRLKRVFDVRAKRGGVEPVARRVIAKSVGWGWLGYHAYFAGTRLAGFVPKTIALRDGLLFADWVEVTGRDSFAEAAKPPVDRMAKYVAARTRELRLSKDPVFDIDSSYGWTGWGVLVEMLRRVYGLAGRLKLSALHNHLANYVTSLPALTDGQMRPEDWIHSANGFQKVDFEHHNFGRTELYIVDPAYDLVTATFEFALSEREENELIQAYADASGDSAVDARILLWKLVHGTVVNGQAIAAIALEKRTEAQQQWHRRFYKARNFLVHEMNRFNGSLLPHAAPSEWTGPLFVTDLDGVFDTEIFGFPHTTTSGLVALAALQSHGYSVIVNTARGITDVLQYCSAYRLPGGIAESGAIFVDAVNQKQISLIEPQAAQQLARCRETMEASPGVFVDPNYRHTIRAYRSVNRTATGIPEAEMRSLLARPEFDRLTFIPTSVDTTVLPKGAGKGPALKQVKQYLGITNGPVVAVGDNDQDVEMLRAATIAYAPANASQSVRDLAAAGHCKLTRHPAQKGLLDAVKEVIHSDGRACEKCDPPLIRATGFGGLIQTLLEISERSRSHQLLSLFNRRRL